MVRVFSSFRLLATIKLYLHLIKVFLSLATNKIRVLLICRKIRRLNPDTVIIFVNLSERLGDLVTCEPISRYLKRIKPNSFVIWGVHHDYRELLDDNPHIDQTLSITCLGEGALVSRFKAFDEVVQFTIHGRHCPVCGAGAGDGSGTSRIAMRNLFFLGETLQGLFCESAGIPKLNELPKLYIPRKAIDKVSNLKLEESYLCIHTVSCDRFKNWSYEKCHELILELNFIYGLRIVEVGKKPVLSLRKELRITNLCGRLSISESVEVIRNAILFVGVDSGPAHVANSVGTRGVIITPYLKGFFMPFTRFYDSPGNAQILFGNGSIDHVEVEEVLAACDGFLNGC